MSEEQKKKQTVEWIATGILLLLGFYNHLALICNWPHIEVVDAEVTKLVDWFYSLVIGFYAYWKNNNVSPDSKVSQTVLNSLRSGVIKAKQVETLLNNKTVQQMITKLNDREVTNGQLQAFIDNKEFLEIADAHNEGKTVDVNIPKGE